MNDFIEVNKQSSIRIKGDKIIYFDPIEVNHKKDADYIFITHPHWDHFSLLSILEIKKEDTLFITPKDIVEELLSIGISEEYIIVVKPGEDYAFKNIEFKTIPAYNLHKKNHPKSALWVGYLLKYNNITYYIPGDTDVTKENKNIKCDICFLPIGGRYTMDCIEAANLCNIINPKIAIPIHYGYVVGSMKDASVFKKRINSNIKCLILLKEEKNA